MLSPLNNLKAVSFKIADTSQDKEIAGWNVKYVTSKEVEVRNGMFVVELSDKSILIPAKDVESFWSEDVMKIGDKYFRRYNLASEYWEPVKDATEITYYLRLNTIYNETYIVLRTFNRYGNYVYSLGIKEEF